MIRRVLLTAGSVATLALMTAPALAQEEQKISTYEMLSLFGEVLEKVRTGYVEPVNDEALIEAALNGMLTSLDPHSSYMSPKSFKDWNVQIKGEFGGLGIEVTMENGWVKVVTPIDDTPAARAGLRPGDLVTHLNGEAVQGLTLNEAVDRMRGAPNTDIKLTIRRGTQAPFDVTLTRAVIRIQTVKSKMLDQIGYVRITQFGEQTEPSLRRALEGLKKTSNGKMAGLVLDLRNNPGGLLKQAVDVTGDLAGPVEVVSTRGRRSEETMHLTADGLNDLTQGLPIVVLINDGSASASEIVAGALQDHKRAVLMGTRSFGKGSVQTITDLHNHGAIRMTTARYYTPSGRSIQAVGIEPDVKVLPAKVDIAAGARNEKALSEASLRGALRNDTLPDGTKPADKVAEDDKTAVMDISKMGDPTTDYQLSQAMALLLNQSEFKNQMGAAAVAKAKADASKGDAKAGTDGKTPAKGK